MTYQEAFGTSAEYMGHSPFSSHKLAWRSFLEWRWYMEDLVKAQRETRLLGQESQNLLDSLVAAGDDEEKGRISESAILGNIWVFVLGGYHTSSNTLHFIFILLAIHPEIQRELQKSLDEHFGDRPPSTWTHEVDFPALLNGHLGAVIAETVRVFGVLPFIPKSTGSSSQTLTLDGGLYTVPAETTILINTSAVHRNPKYWPITPPKPGERAPFPVSNWDPWRWLQIESGNGLFNPRPGSYISFSEGARQCIGKRFAQVELCAVLARVLKEGSIELAVKGGNSEKGSLDWAQARDHAIKELSDGVGFGMSLELFGKVELSFVSRD
ncbi:uncharacterized protein BP5553_07705 [Venustampulla echinocandica]|uniref:Cytochrome P450 n=1 Tax=Venustampulla echinocandica TaxID=2656787 RepID=A0A370THA1_9HELO|nr:uncharacterized protein BP5553_07705 [Venustampulla echinocandica]RDL34577.1 hypothetical protein BP5553_07705 [Venustampulla echinocandica]